MPKQTETSARKPAKRPARKEKPKREITHEHIAARAYFIHLEEGGDPQSNWLRAERELLAA
jgi:hypothetical protein